MARNQQRCKRCIRKALMPWVVVVLMGMLLSFISSAGTAETIKVAANSWPTFDRIKEMIPEFERKTGIKVEVEETPYMEFHGKLMLGLTAQTGMYDLITLNPDWAPGLLAEGFLYPFDEFLQDPSVSLPGFDVEDFFASSMERFIYEGKVYGFPFETGAFVNYYRTDLFQQKGLDVPQTWDEYAEVAKKLTLDINGDGEIDIYGANLPGKRTVYAAIEFITRLWSYGGEVVDKDWNPTFNGWEGLRALQDEVDLIYKYKVCPKGVLEYGYDGMGPLFLEGKLAMATDWIHVSTFASDPEKSKVVDKWWLAPRPGIGWTGTWSFALPADSKHKEAAFRLAQYLTTKDALRKLALQGISSPRASVMKDPKILEQYPTFRPIVAAIERARPVFFSLVFEQMFDILALEVSSALAGQKSAQEALNDGATQMRKVFEQEGYYK